MVWRFLSLAPIPDSPAFFPVFFCWEISAPNLPPSHIQMRQPLPARQAQKNQRRNSLPFNPLPSELMMMLMVSAAASDRQYHRSPMLCIDSNSRSPPPPLISPPRHPHPTRSPPAGTVGQTLGTGHPSSISSFIHSSSIHPPRVHFFFCPRKASKIFCCYDTRCCPPNQKKNNHHPFIVL